MVLIWSRCLAWGRRRCGLLILCKGDLLANRAGLVSAHVGRAGVHALARLVEGCGHAFREHFVHDLGIDGHIELFDSHGYPTGRFIAVQIKGGRSYFRGCDEHVAKFYFADRHRAYWQQHQMPVILVLHDPDSNRLIWQHVCSENIVQTSGRWRIDVPFDNDLSARASFVRLEVISASQTDVRGRLKQPRSGRLLVYRQIDPTGPDVRCGYPFCATDGGRTSLLIISKEFLGYCSKNYLEPDEFSKEYVQAGFSLEFSTDFISNAIRSAFMESFFEVIMEPERDGSKFLFYIGPNEKYYLALREEEGAVLIEGDQPQGLTLQFATRLFAQVKAQFTPLVAFTNSETYRKADHEYPHLRRISA